MSEESGFAWYLFLKKNNQMMNPENNKSFNRKAGPSFGDNTFTSAEQIVFCRL